MGTTSLGLGFGPLGGFPGGLYAPATADSPEPSGLDPALAIDPYTRSYTMGADGNLVRGPAARALVHMALFTVFGSSAEIDLGLDKDPRVITDRAPQQMTDAVRRALGKLITDKVIQMVRVEVLRSVRVRTRMERVVVWHDLATGSRPTEQRSRF